MVPSAVPETRLYDTVEPAVFGDHFRIKLLSLSHVSKKERSVEPLSTTVRFVGIPDILLQDADYSVFRGL